MPADIGEHPVCQLLIAKNGMPRLQLLHERHKATKPQGRQTNAPVLNLSYAQGYPTGPVGHPRFYRL